ncbi:hypothetical protein C8P63_11126 [Melghirimyces profundicolus]|uniref:Uncharacterized protein n=1 Tax=Melghirimyces profundicolus TaxID=1242148 RepID=A0A2T6BU31_9BACL|nr:hypothetical protein C8P63_11126 [Melghirimyces profundicolus]
MKSRGELQRNLEQMRPRYITPSEHDLRGAVNSISEEKE